MDLHLTKEQLAKLLKNAKPCTSNICSSVKLTAEGDLLTVQTTDLDRWHEEQTEAATINQDGAAIVNLKALEKMVKGIKRGSSIRLHTEDKNLIVSTGAAISTMLMDAEADYPHNPKLDPKASCLYAIKADSFRQAIDNCLYCISTDDARPTLQGIAVQIKGQKLMMVSTDGHRLAKWEAKTEIRNRNGKITCACIIPRATAKHLQTMLKSFKGSHVGFAYQPSATNQPLLAMFIMGNITLRSRLIDGTFPDFTQVIPDKKTEPIFTARFAADDLLPVVERITAALDCRNTQMVFNANSKIMLSASCPDLGTIEAEAKIKYKGEVKVGVNGYYVAEQLKVMKGLKAKVQMRIYDTVSPIVFEAGDSLHVVMPMRL